MEINIVIRDELNGNWSDKDGPVDWVEVEWKSKLQIGMT